MARTGRPRKPTAIHVLNGNPGRRDLPANEPRPLANAVTCPTWLDAYARREWHRRAPEQIGMGVLTNADVMSFAGYCQAVSDVRRLQAFIEEHGTKLPITKPGPVDAEGEPTVIIVGFATFPEVKMLENAWVRLRAFASDFGLNPSARSRISVPEKKVSALDALLG